MKMGRRQNGTGKPQRGIRWGQCFVPFDIVLSVCRCGALLIRDSQECGRGKAGQRQGASVGCALLMSLFRGRFADALFAGRHVRRINHIHLDALVEQLLCFCDILREAPIDLATVGVIQRRVQGRPQPADPLTYLYHLLRDLIH